jgi:hypothetical protein
MYSLEVLYPPIFTWLSTNPLRFSGSDMFIVVIKRYADYAISWQLLSKLSVSAADTLSCFWQVFWQEIDQNTQEIGLRT